ncbi:MAG: 23S rRNA (guanosine(2251)-2'-O)-methyltransferase RlmB [Candidatus Gastranaerophilales bacterium]|nr:23S rRNA (guanosine(2251)-2'-O)-methyltransferase RlmB [Candidatus Gastranaerophilales bacterium]
MDYIYGKNTVLETLISAPKRVNKVFIQKGSGLDNRLKKIKEICSINSIPLEFTDFKRFKTLFEGDTNLQCVVAYVSPVSYKDFDEFLAEDNSEYRKIIILDGVNDPHNFGAIIRTAAAGGYDAVIIQNHRSSLVNSTVEKTSSGAVNKVSIIKVNSLNSAVQKLKDNNWWIIALTVHTENNYLDIDYKNMNFALVFGNEGAGITKTLINMADYKVKLPTNFESLNVSCCCAVMVYETMRQINYT